MARNPKRDWTTVHSHLAPQNLLSNKGKDGSPENATTKKKTGETKGAEDGAARKVAAEILLLNPSDVVSHKTLGWLDH